MSSTVVDIEGSELHVGLKEVLRQLWALWGWQRPTCGTSTGRLSLTPRWRDRVAFIRSRYDCSKQLELGGVACSPQCTMLLTSPLSRWTRVCLQTVAHQSDSLDLTPPDFLMFGSLKINLRGQRVTTDDTAKSEAQKWLRVPDISF
jgi:hypothetical protein